MVGVTVEFTFNTVTATVTSVEHSGNPAYTSTFTARER
ncbi:hypothetical protein BH23CHL2_BH23CHL2_06490 [soil metagenome]